MLDESEKSFWSEHVKYIEKNELKGKKLEADIFEFICVNFSALGVEPSLKWLDLIFVPKIKEVTLKMNAEKEKEQR